MTTSTMTFTGVLVIEVCWCGIQHAVPRGLRDHMKQQHDDGVKQMGIYCPLGHTWVFGGKGEADRLREEKARLERVAESRSESLRLVREQRDAAQRQASAYKGQATKARKRAQAALCPVQGCNRTFVQLKRHLDAKHPGYAASHDHESAKPDA